MKKILFVLLAIASNLYAADTKTIYNPFTGNQDFVRSDSYIIGISSGNMLSSTNTWTGSNYFNGGNVGVGTASPIEKLSIGNGGYINLSNGAGTANRGTYITNVTGNSEFLVGVGGKPSYSSGYKITPEGTTASMLLGTAGTWQWFTNSGLTAGAQSAALTPKMYIQSDGNVGIGTSAPVSLLNVNGSLMVGGATAITTTSTSQLKVKGPDDSGATSRTCMTFGNGGYAAPSNNNAESNGDKWVFWNSAAAKGAMGFAADEFWTSLTDVGANRKITWYLGSTAPSKVMELNSTGFGIGCSPTGKFQVLATATTFFISTDGNVGIGTTSPSVQFQIGASTFAVTSAGNVGVGTLTPTDTTPTFGVSLTNDTISISTGTTAVGGGISDTGAHFVWIKNKTGHTSVKGEVVERSLDYDLAVTTSAANSATAWGICLDAGIIDGSWMRVGTNGLMQVLFENSSGNITADQAGLVITAATAGRAMYSTSPGATHDQEIGHPAVATATIGTGTLVWCFINVGR